MVVQSGESRTRARIMAMKVLVNRENITSWRGGQIFWSPDEFLTPTLLTDANRTVEDDGRKEMQVPDHVSD